MKQKLLNGGKRENAPFVIRDFTTHPSYMINKETENQ